MQHSAARPVVSGRHTRRCVCEATRQHCSPARRALLALLPAALVLPARAYSNGRSDDNDFTLTASGLRYLDVRVGTGDSPKPGDMVSVHWSGFTSGYQGKRIDNTSVRDEPFDWRLGDGTAIAAFEEAVLSMKAGGVRRVEVPGENPALSYPRDRALRFTNELFDKDLKTYRYRVGPQPAELGGQRALDFVLDNDTLQPFNRTLLFDIKLLAVRKRR